jgi:sulfate transport system ATP-binding protein
MAIRIDQASKLFHGIPVVNDVSLEVARGELFVLLGPSGSGKSTLLRAIAGLSHIDHGRIWLGGRDVTARPARKRGVGMVFQHYALFRHMSVAENIEFALRVRRASAATRRARRRDLLQLVALEGYDDRFPSQLSGGQQQRVAVARALAHEPEVLLLDEPFGALDARIRVELRETVRAVQKRTGMTTILVTHDQEEAFALGDRMGVMQMGRLLETGTPQQLYRHPATRFVARFLGAANLLLGHSSPAGLRVGPVTLPTGDPTRPAAGAESVIVVRPEDVELWKEDAVGTVPAFARGTVSALTFGGHQQQLQVQLDADADIEPALAPAEATQAELQFDVLRPASQLDAVPLVPGDRVWLGLRRAHALPTPVSAFRVLAKGSDESVALRAHPLFVQLVRSMQARTLDHTGAWASERLDKGICVLALDTGTPDSVRRAVAQGARHLLCLPVGGPMPRRLLLAADEVARDSALAALASSLMRHLQVVACSVTIQRPRAGREEAEGARRSLELARSTMQTSHGFDLRGERFVGERRAWISDSATQPDAPVLAFSIPSDGEALRTLLAGELAALFTSGARASVLLSAGAD